MDKKTILIVEDEKFIMDILVEGFNLFSDFQIFCASDGEEALKEARAHNPDAILLDLQLPKIGGFEVCRQVKSDPSLKQTKVMILSGFTQSSDRQKALEVGADAFAAKPFQPSILVKQMEKLLCQK